jgi:hypothetical protein
MLLDFLRNAFLLCPGALFKRLYSPLDLHV